MKYKILYSLPVLFLALAAHAQDASDVFGDTTKVQFSTSTIVATSTVLDDDTPTSTMPTFIANPIPADIAQELAMDEVKAEDLGVSDPQILPGDSGYWWQNLKRQLRITFTLNAEKKAQAILDDANTKILEAKKLSEKTNDPQAAERISKVLSQYTERMQQLREKLQSVTNDQKILENLDKNFLAHEQLFRNLQEKLPGAQDEIDRTRLEAAKNWYEVNRQQVKERLQKAAQNTDGSKFVQLQNLLSTQELTDLIPQAADQIDQAQQAIADKLQSDLTNSTPEDRDKIDTYIEKINANEIDKQKVLENLNKVGISADIRARLEQIKNRSLERLKNNWQNLSDDQKNAILRKLNSGAASPSNIQIINQLRNSIPADDADKLQTVLDSQTEALKTKIRAEINNTRLDQLEQKLKELPALRLEIRDRQLEINSDKVIFIPNGGTSTSTGTSTSSTTPTNSGGRGTKVPFQPAAPK